MSGAPDRLFDLLPTVYRQRDTEEGWPLRALLRVVDEQVNVVEDDIAQLYENWFIETAEDWVVPYIGDLIGYRVAHEAGEPGIARTARAQQRNAILIPRRDVADTIRDRRRKGTLAILEELSVAVAGWPARAQEFFRLLATTVHVNHVHPDRGRTLDLRDGKALDLIDGPFHASAHAVEVRRPSSHRGTGRYNIPSVGLFVWRLRSYPVTQTPAYSLEEIGPYAYTFSALGNDTPLFVRPASPVCQPHPPGELALPVPVRRRAFCAAIGDYYGESKSLRIWVGSPRRAVPPDQIVTADLSNWQYRPLPGHVAVDPERGRIVFPPGQIRRQNVWVSYGYGFSGDIGGGEYDRPITQPAGATRYPVGEREQHTRIGEALAQWQQEAPANAVIEITDSGVYTEEINITLKRGQTLQIRAANRTRPIIRLLHWHVSLPDDLSARVEAGTPTDAALGPWLVLDGLLITGRGVQIEENIAGVVIRHSTLVPGWGLHNDCEPHRPAEPSIELVNGPRCLVIEHSIVGAIQVIRDEAEQDPVVIRISDSILDATNRERVALGGPEGEFAYAALTIARSTVIGQIQTHAIDLGENSLFASTVRVARRQRGCLRFSYVPPGSRTPRRYECQPDLVETIVTALFQRGKLTPAERDALVTAEQLRVEPVFNSTRYGKPTYCQLALVCAEEITRGADDESEMGVFHDLYQPQRAANLRARLDEYVPAGADAGIIFVT